MAETEKGRDTLELEKILRSTHASQTEKYLKENADSLLGERAFTKYMREKIESHNMLQQEVFLLADISERYGYKIISGEKRTSQRDTILRICYAAKFTLDEVQHALKLYSMPELYAKVPRDAIIMIAFNEHRGDIIEVNQMLKENRQEMLRSCGMQN